MTYFPDLTPYRFISQYAEPNTLNVGWLDQSQTFNTGITSTEFHSRLAQFCLCLVLPTRGFHFCNICREPSPAMNDSHQMGLGSAEIRVFFNEIVYAAPNLIYHYVIVHAYKPPDAFIEAVLRGFLPQTSEYDELINRLGVDYRFISFD